TFSLIFMLVVVILGAAILILLYALSIRERKYEIGVIRAMGMKKSRVARGLWYEIVVLTAVCLLLGVGVGDAVAQPISSALLTAQVQAAESTTSNSSGYGITNRTGQNNQNNQNNQGYQNGGFGGYGGFGNQPGQMAPGGGGRVIGGRSTASTVKPLSEMTVTVGWETILEIIAIALVLSSLAAVFSIMQITRYEPIKILTERN
ncbi:MAG: FtsX-like permease family protein, partial [Oscillospiraceae bacterium]|nr:FtsX-like permease family protein [Oscillospiraceae bacterium]